MSDTASLWDWRRRVADLYAAIRKSDDPYAAWCVWRDTRNDLFANHSQSPIENKAAFTKIPLFEHDPGLRFLVATVPAEPQTLQFEAGNDGVISAKAFARTVGLQSALGGELTLYWFGGYAGGVFLPFTDATSGRETYGGGRYVLDTMKSADLGAAADGRIILDFNFSYAPSCAHNPRWVCPLSPLANRLPRPVHGGERLNASEL